MATATTPRSKRTRPAQSDRQALARWGLGGKPRLESAPAYTAEDFAQDEAAGVIVMPARRCPCDRPERECKCRWWEARFDLRDARFIAGDSHRVPAYYRHRWQQKITFPPRAPTRLDPNPLPRRETTLVRMVCFECRISLRAWEHARFVREHGEYRLEDAPLDVKRHQPDVLIVCIGADGVVRVRKLQELDDQETPDKQDFEPQEIVSVPQT